MNILFISLEDFRSFDERNIYTDIIRNFKNEGHTVCCISPVERRKGEDTQMIIEDNCKILKLKIGNTQKVNLIEKGISTLLLEPQMIRGIKKYFSDIKFDLVLYPTPPVTFAKAVRYVKKRDGAKSYLMLKDIFPQNSLDLGMLKTSGLKGFIYRHFKKKEKSLYMLSDKIGCMSQANCDYLLKHNGYISPDKVEICPNCIDPQDLRLTDEEKTNMRVKYGLPTDKKIFVYGGNLGRPQDVPFIIECLKACKDTEGVYFVIAGSGTDRYLLEEYVNAENPEHVKLFGFIPKDEYDKMVACCDVGLIFLDHRFTIPNFPSRLLSYMQAGLPVLACTDPNTDVGQVIVGGGFGWWCESNDAEGIKSIVCDISRKELTEESERSWQYLLEKYNSRVGYSAIEKYLRNK